MSTYTRWYRDGSVTLTKGSNAVVGVNTYWLTAGLNPGDIFKIDGVDYEIVSITDNTHLTIAGNYAGTTGSDKAYAIVRNFTATMPSKIASQTAELLGDFAKYVDTDMQTIHGKSAYQIACEHGYVGTESQWVADLEGLSAYEVAQRNGYSGTEAQWLESLKANNEWSTLNSRTEPMTWWDSAALHNSVFRGKNLGSTFTAAQQAAIYNQNFKDLWLGDYWSTSAGTVTIAGFNYQDGWPKGKAAGLGHASITLIGTHQRYNLDTDEQRYAVYGESTWYTIGGYNIYAPIAFSSNDTNGVPTSYSEYTSKVHLITYSMVTGFSPYHAMSQFEFPGIPKRNYYQQLPIFRMGEGRAIGYSIIATEGGYSFKPHITDVHGSYWGPLELKGNGAEALPVFHVTPSSATREEA